MSLRAIYIGHFRHGLAIHCCILLERKSKKTYFFLANNLIFLCERERVREEERERERDGYYACYKELEKKVWFSSSHQ